MSDTPRTDYDLDTPAPSVFGRAVKISPPHTLQILTTDLDTGNCQSGSLAFSDLQLAIQKAVVYHRQGLGEKLEVLIEGKRHYVPGSMIANLLLGCRYALEAGVIPKGTNTEQEKTAQAVISAAFSALTLLMGEDNAILAFMKFFATHEMRGENQIGQGGGSGHH